MKSPAHSSPARSLCLYFCLSFCLCLQLKALDKGVRAAGNKNAKEFVMAWVSVIWTVGHWVHWIARMRQDKESYIASQRSL